MEPAIQNVVHCSHFFTFKQSHNGKYQKETQIFLKMEMNTHLTFFPLLTLLKIVFIAGVTEICKKE